MTFEELKEKAHGLPLKPGVYIMQDAKNEVIYVGKAKLLRNRVANYFQPPERLNAKTRQLVSHIDTFDIIVTESEFEALVLENSMIKKYQPKYNILLKDDKGYPYIRLDTTQDYPRFTVVSRPAEDGARYFGPYMGRKAAFSAIDTISEALHLATCSRVFPRDIGKDRPCLNQHLGRCCAPCTGRVSAEEYRALILQAASSFEGGAKQLERELTEKMNEAAEELQFERAADLRDRLRAIHLNDSLNERGAHKDRHARIGEGCIGLDALVRVIRHPALQGLPFILETPNDHAGYAREIALLRAAWEEARG